MIDNFLKSFKISRKARLRIVRVEKRTVSEEPASSAPVMPTLQGISILITMLVSKRISLNILPFLTNTFNG